VTLKELYDQVKGEKLEKTPSDKELINSGSPIIASWKCDETEMTAFENGYILYSEWGHHTVFHVSDIYTHGMEYQTYRGNAVPRYMRYLDANFFHDKDWRYRVIMLGNDRIVDNRGTEESEFLAYHFSSISYELEQVYSIPNDSDDEDEIDEEEFRKWIRSQITEIKKYIKPTQWKVYVNITAFDKKETEIAEQMKISQQAVSKTYKRSIKNISEVRKKYFSKEKVNFS